MSLINKLRALKEKTIYVTAEKLRVNTAYSVKGLRKTTSKYDRLPAIIAHLRFTDTVTGEFYLPARYARDPKTALTDADIAEFPELLKNGHTFYVVKNDTVIAGTPDTDFLSASASDPLPPKYTIYDGMFFFNPT